MKSWLLNAMFLSAVLLQAGGTVAAPSGRTPIETRSRDPYLGAIVVEAATGQVVFENNADAPGYPASVIKLMVLLIIQERIDNATLRLTDVVTVTAEAAQMGGSQVYLKEHETFPIEDLLYALIIQSANDAAAALAIHVGGTRAGFIELMNRRAQELGMKATQFHSVHGLPPSQGVSPDVSTARDLVILAREILKHPACLTYTSTRERGFRNGTFGMRTHNHLLGTAEGCDGLKTGYFTAAGFSSIVTAQRGGRRVVVVLLGSPTREGRDNQARTLLATGFSSLPAEPPPAPAVVEIPVPAELPVNEAPEPEESTSGTGRRILRVVFMLAVAAGLLGLGIRIGRRRQS